ncbi:MAG: hypothetical protein H0W61_10235 [Bacteroidetes bacterium]|nr:hypothetical protein [Bacteroidota bacterium]
MEKNENTKRYKIPQDLLMDILRILFGNKIKHQIEGIKEKENIIILQVYYTDTNNSKATKENIETLLTEYSEYMEGLLSDNTLFMDEEEEDNQ